MLPEPEPDPYTEIITEGMVSGSRQMHLENELKSNYPINFIIMLHYVTFVDEQEHTKQRLTKSFKF